MCLSFKSSASELVIPNYQLEWHTAAICDAVCVSFCFCFFCPDVCVCVVIVCKHLCELVLEGCRFDAWEGYFVVSLSKKLLFTLL